MWGSKHHTLVEIYRTFQIMKCRQPVTRTLFYQIFRNEKLYSQIAAGSPKGCKNIIDTYWGYPEDKETENTFILTN